MPELEEVLQHFTIPFRYPQIYTYWIKYTINHLTRDKRFTENKQVTKTIHN
ncbi:hypothetical protein PXD04_11655 (plasmid) [Methanosphaera sp. ISO3-F5]|uniref:hypothetical protein n=1 Tax=Methanosphaera sp. ISO3-F5 TaxID=1452353 RepID=UPI002B261D6A|nr:hypothetical protein [Methanosphaera sp. ISO3-F5]WQH65395.1 hypothetical protein PXD04_11655 [Methanosphaera sp. ISO3-F5]